MQFRKKPVVIEAMQFTGENFFDCLAFMGPIPEAVWMECHTTDLPVIHTLEGDMVVSVGDWIIRGVKGEFYPCKPDIFEATYEPVVPSPV